MPPFRTWGLSKPNNEVFGALERCEGMRRVSDGLRRLTERANEATAHALATPKARCSCNLLNGKSSLFEHQPRGFEPKSFDRFGRRESCLRAKHATELARAEAGSLSKVFDGKRRVEISSGEHEGVLDPI